jgi:hypothetical protein
MHLFRAARSIYADTRVWLQQALRSCYHRVRESFQGIDRRRLGTSDEKVRTWQVYLHTTREKVETHGVMRHFCTKSLRYGSTAGALFEDLHDLFYNISLFLLRVQQASRRPHQLCAPLQLNGSVHVIGKVWASTTSTGTETSERYT